MDDGIHPLGGLLETCPGHEIDSNITDGRQASGGAFSGRGRDDLMAPPGQLADQPPPEDSPGACDKDRQSQLRTTVRLCSRMYWRRYQGPPPPPPEVPEPFQPPKDWASGQAPVVAPAFRLT